MTPKELEKICKILITADNGCPCCVPSIFNEFIKEFPDENIQDITNMTNKYLEADEGFRLVYTGVKFDIEFI